MAHSQGIISLGIALALQLTTSNFLSEIWLLRDYVVCLGDKMKLEYAMGAVIRLRFRSTWVTISEAASS